MYIITPQPHTSTGLLYGCLATTSGAIKCGVPIRPEINMLADCQKIHLYINILPLLIKQAYPCKHITSVTDYEEI